MWKVSFTLLILLNSFIGGLLFWQWDAYSQVLDSTNSEQVEKVKQKVTVTSKGNQLHITQLFTGLNSDKEYRIMAPEKVQEWGCVKSDGNPCESVDDNPSSYLADANSLTINYLIDMKENNSPFLLNHWLVYLPDVETTHTSIEVIDTSRRKGSWVAGLPLKGHNKFELIDYYVFEGLGDNSSLYWQPTPLKRVYGEQGIQYYSAANTDKNSLLFNSLHRIPNFKGLSIVVSDVYPETNGVSLMIVHPNITNEVIERKIIYNYLMNKTDNLPLEERWLIDVLTSIITGQDSNVPKGQEFIKELKGNLTEDELLTFTNMVINETLLTAQKLDNLLGNLAGKSTHFFTLNKNEETMIVPLYYFDPRRIMIQDKLQENFEVLIMSNNDRYYPFTETMNALGFNVKVLVDNETVLLNKEDNSYRFYVNQNIFIYNEEDYGLLENPLTYINGKVYIESSWLETIFKVDFQETKEEIKVTIDY